MPERVDLLHAVTSSLSLVFFKGQMAYLRRAGFHPAALSGPGPHVEVLREEESVPVFTVETEREIAPLHDLKSLLRVYTLVRRLRPVICNVGTPKAGLLVGLAAWLSRVPCRVYTIYGLRLETAFGLKRWILGATERIACACAHRVVCVSPSLRQRVIELGLVAAGKTIVLASGSCNGVDPRPFTDSPEIRAQAAEIRRQLGVEAGQPIIGFVGRLTRDKGITELLQAFRLVRRSFPEALLVLIGVYEKGDPVPPATCAEIESDPGIVSLGFVPDVTPYYLAMDIFVLPTYREGFPISVLEAQAAARPVVTTRATGAIDSIVDGVTGVLVPVGDAQALANALVVLLSNPELARQMGLAGRERMLQEFTQETIWEALTRFYHQLMHDRGLTAPLPQGAAQKANT